MAPEQVEGRTADVRTDIWAFGCVLYEMIAGRRPFDGGTQATLIAAILEREPAPPTGLRPGAPALVDPVVQTCLAKDPDERWQSAADVARQLRWIADQLRRTPADQKPVGPAPWARRALWISAGLAFCLVRR